MNKPLYEYLPTIYIGVGLVIGLMFDNMLWRCSAALFVIAGVIVFNMRINFRTQFVEHVKMAVGDLMFECKGGKL